MSRVRWPEPRDGKLFVAANPWPIAAAAKRAGYATDRFRESDFVEDGKVLIIDLDALNVALELPERDLYGF